MQVRGKENTMSNLARREEKEIKKLSDLRCLDNKKIEESIIYINKIHRDDDGFITIGIKDKKEKFYQWCYSEDELIKKEVIQYLHTLKLNTYVSINSFYIPVRNSNNIRRINALYLDIDNHKKIVTKESVQALLEHLQKNYYNKSIPTPTITVGTGRGVQLIFLLEHLPKQGLKFWQNIENELAKRLKILNFKGFELDESCTDVTRVFRMPGTLNTKSNSYAEIIEINNNIYRLDELKKEYFKYIPKSTRKRKNKVLNLTAGQTGLNIYELNWKRREDIQRIQDLRHGECEGLREIMCFLYRYYSCLIDNNCKKALNKMLKFNQRFREPLPLHEVIKATESAEKAYKAHCESLKENEGSIVVFENSEFKLKGYNYTNTKLIKLLKITEEEQEQLLILISRKEKYKRNNLRRTPRNKNGLTQKQQELQDLKNKIIKMKKNKIKNKEIAKELNITIKSLERYITKLKKDDLL
ncbi:hypothetical protein HMPREF1092_03347 [Clostridium thermobutyricum]|uniref:Primase C-terminal 1 domain-containing protein n=1 Tax=Clostridium thermobutyricum TaxID=29372 RepID=N9XS38_9CLOT|nr:hypothetical protein HMPREF1092_03347 [Clostridium thermobutyricum]